MTSRRRTPILSVLAFLLPLLFLCGVYTGGYFWLGKRIDWYGMFPVPDGDLHRIGAVDTGPPNSTLRIYSKQWLTNAYAPAAWVEEKVRGVTVNLDCYDVP